MASVLEKKIIIKNRNTKCGQLRYSQRMSSVSNENEIQPAFTHPQFRKNQSNADINGGLWGKSLSFAHIGISTCVFLNTPN